MASELTKDSKKLDLPQKPVEGRLSFSKLKGIKEDTLHSDAIKIAWKAVRDLVALKLMGERGCAVPHLHEATRYGLLNVLVKERRKFADKITGKQPLLHWSAPLENLLPQHISVEDFRESHIVKIAEEDSRASMQYHIKNSDMKPTHKKGSAERRLCDVEMKLYNIQHYAVSNEHQETPVDLTKHFQGVDTIERIYLITEVYVVGAMVMNVRVGESRYQWNSDTMMPIGFIFRKCDMTPGGMLKYGVEVERKKAIEYNWVTADEKDAKVKNADRHTLVTNKSAEMADLITYKKPAGQNSS